MTKRTETLLKAWTNANIVRQALRASRFPVETPADTGSAVRRYNYRRNIESKEVVRASKLNCLLTKLKNEWRKLRAQKAHPCEQAKDLAAYEKQLQKREKQWAARVSAADAVLREHTEPRGGCRQFGCAAVRSGG